MRGRDDAASDRDPDVLADEVDGDHSRAYIAQEPDVRPVPASIIGSVDDLPQAGDHRAAHRATTVHSVEQEPTMARVDEVTCDSLDDVWLIFGDDLRVPMGAAVRRFPDHGAVHVPSKEHGVLRIDRLHCRGREEETIPT